MKRILLKLLRLGLSNAGHYFVLMLNPPPESLGLLRGVYGYLSIFMGLVHLLQPGPFTAARYEILVSLAPAWFWVFALLFNGLLLVVTRNGTRIKRVGFLLSACVWFSFGYSLTLYAGISTATIVYSMFSLQCASAFVGVGRVASERLDRAAGASP